jgi:hypothetical protein
MEFQGVTHWMLIDGQAIPTTDVARFIEWKRLNDPHIGDTQIGNIRISTVLLPIDHQFGDGPPVIFETMVFGGPLNDEQERYCTLAEARSGHEAMVVRVKEALAICPLEPPEG